MPPALDRARATQARLAGGFALAVYALHAAHYLAQRRPHELLWLCNSGTALVAAGLLTLRRLPAAIGTIWLLVGTPLWLLDLANGSELLATSVLTHFGVSAAGLYGLRRLGAPPRAGPWCIAAHLALLAVSRAVTPRSANVNLVFGVHPGWERWFPHHGVYLALITVTFVPAYLLLGRALRRAAPAA